MCLFLLYSMLLDEKCTATQTEVSLKSMCHFSLVTFKIFPLYLVSEVELWCYEKQIFCSHILESLFTLLFPSVAQIVNSTDLSSSLLILSLSSPLCCQVPLSCHMLLFFFPFKLFFICSFLYNIDTMVKIWIRAWQTVIYYFFFLIYFY